MFYYDGEGVLHRESTKCRRKSEGLKVLRKKEKEVGKGFIKGDYNSTTFDMLVDDYKKEFGKNKRKSWVSLKSMLKI